MALTRTEKIEQAQRAAYRRLGHEHHWLIIVGPTVGKLLGVAGLLAGVYLVGWVMIPHWVLGCAAMMLCVAGLAGLIIPRLAARSVTKRMVNRATGTARPASVPVWAFTLLAFVGFGMGWLALWSPYA